MAQMDQVIYDALKRVLTYFIQICNIYSLCDTVYKERLKACCLQCNLVTDCCFYPVGEV